LPSGFDVTEPTGVAQVGSSTLIEPGTIEEVASVLANASRARQRVAIRGGGTKSGWGAATAAPVDIVLSTARLNAVVAHRHGDLTATVQAGARLADMNRVLARHGQWIPLDPSWSERATIGGIVATNDSGPRRHRYGAPRDLIIGIEVVRADGVPAKAGGIVVKNVAGYDLSRLMTGSFGSLAAIVSATFKLYPRPPASRTVVIDLSTDSARRGGPACPPAADTSVGRYEAIVSALLSSHLTPTAIELQVPPGNVLVRFETIDVAAEQQASAIVEIAECVGCRASVVAPDQETALWDAHSRRPWGGEGAVIKVALLPTDIPATLGWLADAASGADYDVVGRAGVGVLLARIGGDAAHQARLLNGLRDRLPPQRGSAVLLRGSDALKSSVDPWGPIGDGLAVMRTLKHRFDPNGILNPGAGPGGL